MITLDATTPFVDDKAVRHAELVHAAQQFEAVMLGEMMKPLAQPSAIGEDNAEGSGNAMQSYGVEAVAGALARTGALGFAHRIVLSVESHGQKNSADDAQVPPAAADTTYRGIAK